MATACWPDDRRTGAVRRDFADETQTNLRVRPERGAAESVADCCPAPPVPPGGAGPAAGRPHRLRAGPATQGAAGQPAGNHDTVGQPVQRGGADTIGFDGFYNGGTKPAVIDRVVIVSPRHIKLLGAYVVIGGILGNWTS